MASPTLVPSQNATTFNRTGKPGWYSRTIYNYAFADKDPVDANKANLFEIVNTTGVKGSYILPPGYWINNTGRHIRIKGSFRYSGDGALLNMSVGITDGGTDYMTDSEAGNDHNFANTNNRSEVPVIFEMNIMYVYQDDNPAEYFHVTGYYQYEYENYSSGGNNALEKNVLVPLYDNVFLTGMDLAVETRLIIRIQNQPTVRPMWITVEELA